MTEARNGAGGLRVAREQPPALVILAPWPFVAAAAGMVEVLRTEPATAGEQAAR